MSVKVKLSSAKPEFTYKFKDQVGSMFTSPSDAQQSALAYLNLFGQPGDEILLLKVVAKIEHK